MLIMCVSAGKSVGEIAWRCEGIIICTNYIFYFDKRMLNL